MTGQSPARTHITYWTLERDQDTSSRHATLDAPKWEVNGLQPSGFELPQLLHDAGYCTIHAGKAHFGARGTRGADPRAFGFDVNIAGHAAGAPGSYFGRHHFMQNARDSDGSVTLKPMTSSVWDVPGLDAWHGMDVWLDDVLAREASAAIARAVSESKPFYLSFCPYGVHAPIMEDARFAKDYPELGQIERAYATMVAAIDDALGQLIAQCTTLGVLDNTVIIFTSDNGGLSASSRGASPSGSTKHTHNTPLRSGKGSAYDGGLRVPFVVAGPGIAYHEEPLNTPIVGTDLYPTILALAAVARPLTRACDGVDLRPLLLKPLEPSAPIAERSIVFHQPHAWGPTGPGIEPFSAIRRGDWKLVFFHAPSLAHPRIELFNVATDPSESSDQTLSEPVRTAEFAALLRAALEELGAQMPTVRATNALVFVPPLDSHTPAH
jgi:arylsulfatase A-like enzyme